MTETVTTRSGRGRRMGTQSKERQEIPADEFDITELSEESRSDFKRVREERKDQQKSIDNLVKTYYNKWVTAGRPTNWHDMPVCTWTVSRRYYEDAEFYLNKAAQFLGRRLIHGNVTYLDAEGNKLKPRRVTKDGKPAPLDEHGNPVEKGTKQVMPEKTVKVVIPFAVIARTPKKEKATDTENE